MTIRDILEVKGDRVITIEPHHILHLALTMLVEEKVGALVVQNAEGGLIGIITERDLMREVYKSTDLRQTLIKDVMTRELVIGHPDQDVAFAMTAMTEGRFRHLPIVQNDVLVGIVSIGDIVKFKLEHVEGEIGQYKDFVALDWRAS